MKKIFTDNGFHIIYDYDVTQEVGDGFFFTIGYGNMTGGELLGSPMGIQWTLHSSGVRQQ